MTNFDIDLATKIAKGYVTRSCFDHQVDELVNAVYVLGYWKNTEQKYMQQRLHNDIKSYLKDQNGGKSAPKEKFNVVRPFELSNFDRPEGKGNWVTCDLRYDEVYDFESTDFIEGTIKDLPIRIQIIFRLKFLHGMSQVNIAKEIGTSPEMISCILNRAYKSIRKVIERERR